MKRLAPLLIAASIAVVLAAGTGSAGAQGNDGRLELQTTQTAAVTAGDTAWVSVNWIADGHVDDVRVTVRNLPAGVTVTYPTNTLDHSGPMNGSGMLDGELDFTSFRVAVPYGMSDFELKFRARWTTNGKSKQRAFKVDVPVVSYDGSDLQQVTTSAGIESGQSTWIDVWYAGLAPELAGFSLDVAAPGTVPIIYPADGSHTSLHQDDVLEDGESDVARFRLDAGSLSPGDYTLDLVATYLKAGQPAQWSGTLLVTVT